MSNVLIRTEPEKNMRVFFLRLSNVPGRVTLSSRERLTIIRAWLLSLIPCSAPKLASTRSVVVGRKTLLTMGDGTSDSIVFVPGTKLSIMNIMLVTTIGMWAWAPFLLAIPSSVMPRGHVAAAKLLTSEETVELVVLLVRLQCIRWLRSPAFRTLAVVRHMLRVLTTVIRQVTKNGMKTVVPKLKLLHGTNPGRLSYGPEVIVEKLVTLNVRDSVAFMISVTRHDSVPITFPLNRESIIISM